MNNTKNVGTTDGQKAKKFLLKCYSTKEIFEELKTREGVQSIEVEPYELYQIISKAGSSYKEDTGPATILVATD